MNLFPYSIGIIDTNISLYNCSTFKISFPPDEEYALSSKIGWNPWGDTFNFVYDFNKGTLICCNDYSSLNVDETNYDVISALKVYDDGMEWYVEYREDVNSFETSDVPRGIKSILFPHLDGGWNVDGIAEGTDPKIDSFYNYIYGEGFDTLVNVSNAVVNYLKDVSK